MRGRFGLNQHLEFYSPPALQQILKANTKLLGLEAEGPALAELSQRSRGTPRIANRLLRRARDYAAVKGTGKLTLPMVRAALELEGIDDKGLDEQDRQFLRTMIETYDGGPVGIEAIAATMGEERETLEDVIEPYLLQTKPAMLTRTRQGRRATRAAYEHLKLRWKPRRTRTATAQPSSATPRTRDSTERATPITESPVQSSSSWSSSWSSSTPRATDPSDPPPTRAPGSGFPFHRL
jgi:Holliday junction DNA helicase RuvB